MCGRLAVWYIFDNVRCLLLKDLYWPGRFYWSGRWLKSKMMMATLPVSYPSIEITFFLYTAKRRGFVSNCHRPGRPPSVIALENRSQSLYRSSTILSLFGCFSFTLRTIHKNKSIENYFFFKKMRATEKVGDARPRYRRETFDPSIGSQLPLLSF